ncbi:MAG: SDR family oxidoreductase [Chloroflexi bacterium]|nr:SDR family oxidoreductase [Chloroflexota bacterium]
MTASPLILVTGATGYIASRLIPRLLERGYRVRALARQPWRLKGRAWFRHVEVVAGDVMDPSTLPAALEGVHTAYYLIHSMSSGKGYTEKETDGARNFAEAAESAGVEHIIYLGGLADPHAKIAAHMRSRIETGEALRDCRVPVTEFRAGVIVGPGSISFEMIRFMTELLPLVPGPTWMRNQSQPISAQNVFDYLLAALDDPAGRGQVFEIGGPDLMIYSQLMLDYARLRGLNRRMFLLPYIPLWFMAFGVGLTTPVPPRIAYALIDGLRSDSRVQEPTVQRVFPSVQLIAFHQAVLDSLAQLHPDQLEPVWTDGRRPVVNVRHEGFFINHRSLRVDAPPEAVWRVLHTLGGKDGWLYADFLWKLRGGLDALLRPQKTSRPSPLRGSNLQTGDILDFYRVEDINSTRLLLRDEMRVPGDSWMEWQVIPDGDSTHLTQTGYFAPRGLPGFLYWNLLYPIHEFVFRGMFAEIARRSKGREPG